MYKTGMSNSKLLEGQFLELKNLAVIESKKKFIKNNF